MRSTERQRGMTLISWVFVLGIIALVTMVALRLFPVYIEHMAVTSSLDSLANEHEPMSPATIRDALIKRLDINDVESVTRKDIAIERGRGVFKVRIAYEVRRKFLANVDFIVSFDDTVEVPAS